MGRAAAREELRTHGTALVWDRSGSPAGRRIATGAGHLSVMRHLLTLIPDEVVGRDDATTELFGGSIRTFVEASRRRNLCCAQTLTSDLKTLVTVAGHLAVSRYLLGSAW